MSYRIMCGDSPILDFNDEELIVTNPRISLELNKVGEGSFTIYKNHPNFDKIKKLKPIFEVSDEYGVIFRGRATGDTTDFDYGLTVDLEGIMAFFNDSIVRPFDFPKCVETDEGYINSQNRVEYFLGWLITQHNNQVTSAQRFKLGVVTVADPNNYITRSSQDYMTTWEVLRTRLFESSLGGYLCIRYEDDGNYIDYLASFTEENEQSITFGENILDLSNESVTTETYSAMIPLGKDGLTIESLPDGPVDGYDITKSGDSLICIGAREEYRFICAPPSETKWDEVTTATELLQKGCDWLTERTAFGNTINVTAVDLHFADSDIRSLRIYKKVHVRSDLHGLRGTFLLSRLELDLMSPQNTKITVGKTQKTFTEKTTGSFESVESELQNTAVVISGLKARAVTHSQSSLLTHEEYRVFGTVDSLTVNLVPAEDDSAHEYMFEFTASANFTTMTISPDVVFPYEPLIVKGRKYQVSILQGIGVIISVV